MLEDATGSMELLCFSRTLTESGAYLKANLPVVVTGRVSVRDEKAPQLMCDRIRPLTENTGTEVALSAGMGDREPIMGKLYVKVPSIDHPLLRKARLVLNMFPGTQQVILVCADSRKQLGTVAQLHPALLGELREMFGPENVVVK